MAVVFAIAAGLNPSDFGEIAPDKHFAVGAGKGAGAAEPVIV
jgi:hypothetical protein